MPSEKVKPIIYRSQEFQINLIVHGSALNSWDRDNWADPNLDKGRIPDELHEKWEAWKKASWNLEVELRKHPLGKLISDRCNEPNTFPN